MKDIDPAEIALKLQESPKYRRLCPDTIKRIAAWSTAPSRSPKEALKKAKRKLHQIYGAYLQPWDAKAAREILDSLEANPDPEEIKSLCRRMMQLHASTRERLGIVEGLYESIFAATGQPERILDLACGLHPFALPWTGLPRETIYHAWEIDEEIVELLNRFLAVMQFQPLARCRDLFSTSSNKEVDVVFLLKTLPTLERQEKGAGERLLRALRTSFVVVSFPTQSVCGKPKGMRESYAAAMESILEQNQWSAERFERGGELFFIVDKQ